MGGAIYVTPVKTLDLGQKDMNEHCHPIIPREQIPLDIFQRFFCKGSQNLESKCRQMRHHHDTLEEKLSDITKYSMRILGKTFGPTQGDINYVQVESIIKFFYAICVFELRMVRSYSPGFGGIELIDMKFHIHPNIGLVIPLFCYGMIVTNPLKLRELSIMLGKELCLLAPIETVTRIIPFIEKTMNDSRTEFRILALDLILKLLDCLCSVHVSSQHYFEGLLESLYSLLQQETIISVIQRIYHAIDLITSRMNLHQAWQNPHFENYISAIFNGLELSSEIIISCSCISLDNLIKKGWSRQKNGSIVCLTSSSWIDLFPKLTESIIKVIQKTQSKNPNLTYSCYQTLESVIYSFGNCSSSKRAETTRKLIYFSLKELESTVNILDDPNGDKTEIIHRIVQGQLQLLNVVVNCNVNFSNELLVEKIMNTSRIIFSFYNRNGVVGDDQRWRNVSLILSTWTSLVQSLQYSRNESSFIKYLDGLIPLLCESLKLSIGIKMYNLLFHFSRIFGKDFVPWIEELVNKAIHHLKSLPKEISIPQKSLKVETVVISGLGDLIATYVIHNRFTSIRGTHHKIARFHRSFCEFMREISIKEEKLTDFANNFSRGMDEALDYRISVLKVFSKLVDVLNEKDKRNVYDFYRAVLENSKYRGRIRHRGELQTGSKKERISKEWERKFSRKMSTIAVMHKVVRPTYDSDSDDDYF